MSTGFQGQFATISRMDYEGLPRQEKSLAMAGSQKCRMFTGAEAYVRRLFGSRGACGRKDVSITDGGGWAPQ